MRMSTTCVEGRRCTRVDVQFPELPSDADTEIPSWRSGLHSDWRLRLGPTVYHIHKVLTGHGPRASAFLCSAFTTGQQLASNGALGSSGGYAIGSLGGAPGSATSYCEDGAGASCSSGGSEKNTDETDLTTILPELVWPFFGEVLDFVYSGELHLTDDNTVPLLRCADALQIRSLFLQCVEAINDRLHAFSAPRILADSAALLGGALAEQIQKAAQDVISEHFDTYPMSELQRLPVSHLAQILRRDDLSVMHENEVFDRVFVLARELTAHGRAQDAIALWQTVRFGALSSSYIVRAAQIDQIPKMALIWARVLHRKCGSSMLQNPASIRSVAEGWTVGPPRPRKPFKDLVCAVMYSVDTDARNDQDVERNITAATLVAEEIEFLGGRAILENIFARPPSASRDNSEASIINMDQVDVAFVLAPWTPSEKRIARLISFVDQGGGAVLLSFIGGLSKGVWHDRQYEPLITGKVEDNTPYEDVYLAAPLPTSTAVGGGAGVFSSFPGFRDEAKRSQESTQPPRILCGVDSINGRRRITSRLVDGARVLAVWSDGQPLVVQHPEKNVFSVSQRVSRIFELDDDLGHDDTLQLVLNVMVQAGKQAKRLRNANGFVTLHGTHAADSIPGVAGYSSFGGASSSSDMRDPTYLGPPAAGVNVSL